MRYALDRGILRVPHEIGSGEGIPWPVRPHRLAAAYAAQRRLLAEALAAAPRDDADGVLRLVAHIAGLIGGAIAELALGIAAERETGLRLEGVPEAEWLRHGAGAPPITPIEPRPGRARWPMLRRLARVASWTPPLRLWRAALLPDATALTHNGLLRATAQAEPVALGFRRADAWLAGLPRQAPHAQDHEQRAADIALELARPIGLTAELEARTATLLAAHLRPFLARAARDLGALRAARLPRAVWSGTGGNWPARAIGIEVARRGGTVRRFDHGAGKGTLDDPDGLTLKELSVSTEFVCFTPTLAARAKAQAGSNPAAITSARGDPHYARRYRSLPKRRSRPRVLYGPGKIHGLRKLWPLKLSDAVYLDWQVRLARLLAGLPIDLVLKPHPEGVLFEVSEMLARAAPIASPPLEDLLDSVDVVVFDYPASTAFWAALCSPCSFVYLETGLARFDRETDAELRARATIVPITFDVANRPQVERSALEAAVLAPRRGDPEPIRALLAGS